MKRPTGVTILGWLAIVFGAIGLLVSITGLIASVGLILFGASLASVSGAPSAAALAGSAVFLVILTVWTALLSAVEIVFGVGALQLKPWAWSLGMVWTWISAATSVINIFASRGGIFGGIIGIVIAIAILYYLYTDDVRAAFGKSDKAAPAFITPLFMWINGMMANNRGGGRMQPPQGTGGSGGMPPSGGGGYQPPTMPAHFDREPPAPPAPPAQ